ncbi:anaerobic ribonucleoside-triphosphate reductase activating protein [Methanoculleus taiwanensis]|uniref:anaerobic ribonucleoside-triphosphate reductase activating protein n=1 Tax=Methanoculleus taiwanensis TaxID=1550565 RepID=UPI001F4FA303|nr:anaerobic ribonucleoside-triphosphate reductase activating protein [Methanoculleus taiwanensis]
MREDGVKVNFGGFVPISTVDWRGRAVCTVFFRGCPADCYYCHNRPIRNGEDWRNLDEIVALIRDSRLLISGVVFSGGEATMQRKALVRLAEECRTLGLLVGLHTNGVYPKTLAELLDRHLVDMIALDIKTRFERYDELLGIPATEQVKQSLALCKEAYLRGDLGSFEVVVTLFPGWEDDVRHIAPHAEGLPLVLQQGVFGTASPLTRSDLASIAAPLRRQVRIRTREEGEVAFGSDPQDG